MHFLNVHHCEENIGRLVRTLTGAAPGLDALGQSYREALAVVRPVPSSPAGIEVGFEDGDWGRYLLEKQVFSDIFIGIESTPPDRRTVWSAQVDAALDHIEALDPALRRIVDLLVTDIVLFTSGPSGGGSASHLPGLIAISPGKGWTILDVAESIVHEAVHLNLFVADMLYGMYTVPADELAGDHNRILSAVRVGEMRPLDKAFHAAIVSIPLMYMYHLRGDADLVEQFRRPLLDCSGGCQEKRVLFTDYGKMLTDELHQFAQTLDFSLVERSLSSVEFAFYQPAVSVS